MCPFDSCVALRRVLVVALDLWMVGFGAVSPQGISLLYW